MILLWGLAQDPSIRAVRQWLNRWDADIFFVNHADIYCTEVTMSTEPHLSFELVSGDESCRLEDVSAAYLRPYDYRKYPLSEFHQVHPSDPLMVHHLIAAWAEYTPAQVISRPSAAANGQSYLYQVEAIRASGFRTPESVVTNDAAVARAFESCHGGTTFKTLLSAQNLHIAEHFSAPMLCQEEVDGEPGRVHVVGDECLGPMEVPADVERQAIALTRRLGLHVAGLNLVESSRGEWFCTGVNPNPAFAAYPLGDDVAKALARFLMEAPEPAVDNKKTARPPLNGIGPMGRNYAVLREEVV